MGREQYEIVTRLYDKYADRLRFLLARIQFDIVQDYRAILQLNLSITEENEELCMKNQFPFSSNLGEVAQVAHSFYESWLPDFIQNKEIKEEMFNLIGEFFSEIINCFVLKDYFELFPSDIMRGWKPTDDISVKGILESNDKSAKIHIRYKDYLDDTILVDYSISTMSKILYNFELIKRAQEQDKIL